MHLLLEAIDLVKHFPVEVHRKQKFLHAVDGLNFHIEAGETVGLVGESGCGKSTLVRLLTRTLDLTEGQIRFHSKSIGLIAARAMAVHPLRREIQMVFQDPTDSLNPRYTARQTIAESVRLLSDLRKSAEIDAEVEHCAELVGLQKELLDRYPHQLSGGQKARVGIARAIVTRPRLLVLDEPTAALDVSVQAVILQLLDTLKRELGMSFLFVSHDLNVVRLLCDRVLVMYLGQIVESGPADEVFHRPAHPYTRALIASLPGGLAGGESSESDLLIGGDPQSPIDPEPNRCRLLGRCPRGTELCEQQAPVLREVAEGRSVACHFPAGL
ncbi:MAG: peptide ABC transporter ATP-binding protein [Burkholderiales bacterium RIFCSPLOWO2_02_FULL_57_36]|nr:MAG: peptide ABC transporter ATP-binding protein [Burkholderiales bacterium RIFCSPLOWO2_02_FULL_57_36]